MEKKDIEQLQQQISELTSLVKSMSVVIDQQQEMVSELTKLVTSIHKALFPPSKKATKEIIKDHQDDYYSLEAITARRHAKLLKNK